MFADGLMVAGYVFQFCVRASAGKLDDEEGKVIVKNEKNGWRFNFSGEKPETPLLDTINYPVHMKNLSTQVKYIHK